jgi:hypothetical protein
MVKYYILSKKNQYLNINRNFYIMVRQIIYIGGIYMTEAIVAKLNTIGRNIEFIHRMKTAEFERIMQALADKPEDKAIAEAAKAAHDHLVNAMMQLTIIVNKVK